MARKPHVHATVEEAVALVAEKGVLAVIDVAFALDVSLSTARRVLDGAVHRGELVRDEYDPDGRRLHHHHWRYTTTT